MAKSILIIHHSPGILAAPAREAPKAAGDVEARNVRGIAGGRAGTTISSVWFFVGNGRLGYGDYHWRLYRDYYMDPFPHSLFRARQS